MVRTGNALRKREQAAIEAVARHFSATWEEGEGPSSVHISIAGKRIAVDVTTVKQRIACGTALTKPRLRFDKVALRFIRGLQAALHEAVPDGKVVILTVTAPIRLAAKTAAVLEDRIRSCLTPRPTRVELKDTIHGNQIRVRLVSGGLRGTSKVIGFVHNPDSDADVLLDMACSLLEHIHADAGKRTPARSARERWLVLVVGDGFSHVEAYRQVYAQLSIPTDFTKILMVFAGGRVETLVGAG
jgi:hypothetical protein